jgi:hypothetical protein
MSVVDAIRPSKTLYEFGGVCYLTPRKSPRGNAGGLISSKANRDYFTRLRLASVRRRSALSLMKPAASFWS